MKIAYLSSSIIPSTKANSIQVMKMCEAFAMQGHEVELYARQGNAQFSDDQVFAQYGIGRHRFVINRINAPVSWFIGGSIYGARVAAALNKSEFKPDIIYGRNLYALLACRRFDCPIFYEVHNIPGHPGRWFLENLIFSFRRFGGLVTITRALKYFYTDNFAVLQQARAAVIRVAPDGADPVRIEDIRDVKSFPCKVGYAGSLYPGKGVDLIVNLAALLPEVEFHVAGGSAEEVDWWQKQSCKNIFFHGQLKHGRVRDFLTGNHLLLAPFKRCVSTSETGKGNVAAWMSPLKIFEYMASGRCVVTARLPALEEVLRNGINAVMVDPDSIVEWRDAIIELLKDRNMRDRLANEALRNFSDNYSWPQRAAEIIKFCRTRFQVGKKSTDRRKKCVHIINDLDTGGTERFLLRLICNSDLSKFEHVVISLLNDGDLLATFQNHGIRVKQLGMSRVWCGFGDLARLARLLRDEKPDLVQTWMYYSDIIGGLACKLVGINKVIFSIRHGSFIGDTLRIRLAGYAVAMLSHFIPCAVVACSGSALKVHENTGYSRNRTVVIGNGFSPANCDSNPCDVDFFAEHGIPAGARLAGMIARFNEVKDHSTFFKAAAIVKERHPEVYFVLAGTGIEKSNLSLQAMIREANLGESVVLSGVVRNIDALLARLTVLVSCSISEGFSNVIGEAMAYGVPCVATNVGEAASVIGDTGAIVPPGDFKALAEELNKILVLDDNQLNLMRQRVSSRIAGQFSINKVVSQYEKLYDEVCHEC